MQRVICTVFIMCNIFNNKKDNELLVELMGKTDELRKRYEDAHDEFIELSGIEQTTRIESIELIKRLLSSENGSEMHMEKILDDNKGKMIDMLMKVRNNRAKMINYTGKLSNYNTELKSINKQLDGLISEGNFRLKVN